MATDFKSLRINFDSTQGIVQSEVGAVVFPSNVARADASIKGFDIKYSGDDHHLLREVISAKVESIQGTTVFVRVDFLLRDSSGNIDDPFEGWADVLVVAQLKTPQTIRPLSEVSLEPALA